MTNQGSQEHAAEAMDNPAETRRAEGTATGETDSAALVAKLEREKADLYDRLLRKQADMDNYRKRIEREKGEWYHQGVVDLIKELLPVMDACERALASFKTIPENTSSADTFRSGVELIYKQIQGVMKRFGVTPIEALGVPFDPHLHEAIARVESEAHEENHVIEELQTGYMHREKLLRPSVVKVSMAPSNASAQPNGKRNE